MPLPSLNGPAKETGCVLRKNKDGGEEVTLCELELPLKFPVKRTRAPARK